MAGGVVVLISQHRFEGLLTELIQSSDMYLHRGRLRIVIGRVKFAGKFGDQHPDDGTVTKSVMVFTSAGQLGLDVGQHRFDAMVGPGQFIDAALDDGGAILQRGEPRFQAADPRLDAGQPSADRGHEPQVVSRAALASREASLVLRRIRPSSTLSGRSPGGRGSVAMIETHPLGCGQGRRWCSQHWRLPAYHNRPQTAGYSHPVRTAFLRVARAHARGETPPHPAGHRPGRPRPLHPLTAGKTPCRSSCKTAATAWPTR